MLKVIGRTVALSIMLLLALTLKVWAGSSDDDRSYLPPGMNGTRSQEAKGADAQPSPGTQGDKNADPKAKQPRRRRHRDSDDGSFFDFFRR